MTNYGFVQGRGHSLGTVSALGAALGVNVKFHSTDEENDLLSFMSALHVLYVLQENVFFPKLCLVPRGISLWYRTLLAILSS